MDQAHMRSGEELRNLFMAIVESSDDAIISKDLNGVIVSWNPGAERLFGYTAEEAIGKPVSMLIPADRQNEEPDILRRLRRGERVDHFETVRQRKDGSHVDISLTISPVKNRHDVVVGASKIARDISDRKRSEAILARRTAEQSTLHALTERLHRAETIEEVYAAALNAIERALGCERASILLFDEGGVMRFVAWNGVSEEYRTAVDGHSPWTPDELAAEPITIDDIETSSLDVSLKAVMRREGVRALGFFPLFARGRLIGKFMTYYGTTRAFGESDIEFGLTIARQLGFSIERKRASEEIRSNEERLRVATEAGKIGLWEWDIINDQVTWTDSLYAMHGVTRDAFNAKVDGFTSLVHEDDKARVSAALEASVADDVPYELEFRLRRPDGKLVWILTSARVMRDAKGKAVRLIGATVDITERKEAEMQRDLLVAELSHRVKNTLATVISIEQHSFAKAPSIEDARRSFGARVRALALTHGRLAEGNWAGVSLEDILVGEFAPFRAEDGTNVRMSGPSIRLQPKAALTLGMAVHELTTNAAKYGALSARNGVVDVSWKRDPASHELQIHWKESGGPAVTPPGRSGFGRLLLERALSYDLNGSVKLEFDADGLDCAIAIPLDEHVARPM